METLEKLKLQTVECSTCGLMVRADLINVGCTNGVTGRQDAMCDDCLKIESMYDFIPYWFED